MWKYDDYILRTSKKSETGLQIGREGLLMFGIVIILEDENILRRFVRKIIRVIYGPMRQGREWRIRNNEEIDNIIRKNDIVRFVKARRISWVSRVERPESDERENLHQEKKG
jgi:hypothetical protein